MSHTTRDDCPTHRDYVSTSNAFNTITNNFYNEVVSHSKDDDLPSNKKEYGQKPYPSKDKSFSSETRKLVLFSL